MQKYGSSHLQAYDFFSTIQLFVIFGTATKFTLSTHTVITRYCFSCYSTLMIVSCLSRNNVQEVLFYTIILSTTYVDQLHIIEVVFAVPAFQLQKSNFNPKLLNIYIQN